MRYLPLILAALFFSAFAVCLATAPTDGAAPASGPAKETRASGQDNTIGAGIYVLSIGNFDFTKGTYTLDFYLMFKWNNLNNTPASFEFMNGRPGSKDKIYENVSGSTTEVWYRVQANLFVTPQFKDYPFDTQDLTIVIEDSKYNISNLRYSVMDTVLGVDKQFQISGWKMRSFGLESRDHTYPWGETYSQLTFTITLSRNVGLSAVKLLLPPIIFCIISGLSFFFKADKITHRLGLGTSMLITAVMFHLSQTSALPPLPYLILIDKIMIAVYGFLAASLLVTTAIYINDEFWKKQGYETKMNRIGAVITIVLPFVVFGLLYLF